MRSGCGSGRCVLHAANATGVVGEVNGVEAAEGQCIGNRHLPWPDSAMPDCGGRGFFWRDRAAPDRLRLSLPLKGTASGERHRSAGRTGVAIDAPFPFFRGESEWLDRRTAPDRSKNAPGLQRVLHGRV